MKRSLLLTAVFASLLSAPAFAQAPPPGPAAPPAAPPPRPATPGEADAHFKRGIDLYKDGDFAAALIEFRRAYEIEPKYQALYNIGETYFQLNDYANALRTLEKYLKDGGAVVPAARREEVQKEIDKLRTRVATVDVTTNVPDVEIAVDDIAMGKTPLASPLLVSAGRRRITATRAGKPPVTQIVELAGGDAKKIALTVAGDDGLGEAPQPAKVPAAPWVVTGVLTAGAVVTGVLALTSSGDLKNQINMVPADKDAISSAHSKTFALALTTDILIGAAVVAGGISIYFTATAGSKSDKASPLPPPQASRGPRVAWSSPFARAPAAPGAGRFLRIEAGPESARLSGSF
jgi:hypothetical protein